MSNRCLYSASFAAFIAADPLAVAGEISHNYHGNALTTTRVAWEEEIDLLRQVLRPWVDEPSQIIFEYDIPRLGKRIDVVLQLRGLLFCLEFKVGQRQALQADVEQVMDYALDLKNFHRFSRDSIIVPVLVPTEHATATSVLQASIYHDRIVNPLISGSGHLQSLIAQAVECYGSPTPQPINPQWIISPYAPTPTIVEAACALYSSHSVEEITRHEADKAATDTTINFILQVIDRTRERSEKSICFVTGVPGAGKTLVGLDVAVKQSYRNGELDKENGAVYLSGNGPLVAVLTEALARDNVRRHRAENQPKKMTDARREVSQFIQIIHRYRDNMLAKIKNPVENGEVEIDPEKAVAMDTAGYGEVEHVAIFDEAQRSWTHKRIADYLRRGGTYGNKLKVPNFPMSEAEFLIWSLDQRRDWAVIVCLVGGGQEINTGEAGISEWIAALNNRFPHWNVYISNQLTAPEYAEGKVNQLLQCNTRVHFANQLHLAVSMRSFRAETLSAFVHSLLTFAPDAAALYADISAKQYPVVLTRSIDKAREWLREQARGSQRTGVLVSKVAARFKPQAISVLPSDDDNAVHWFLEDKTDVRSSNYLEEAATEIQVQGLELDYVCVLWDADMRVGPNGWEYYKFHGNTKWIPECNPEVQRYMLNAYRVLLTRARQGVVICVPEGNHRLTSEGFPEDSTRLPQFYDPTFDYFRSIPITLI